MKHVILKFSKSKAEINEAAILNPHNGYTVMRKQYENGFYSTENDHTGLSLVSAESQIESFIGEEEAYHIEMLKK